MKAKITILAVVFVFAINPLYSAVLTVSNDPVGGAQYNGLQNAYDAASNGDTLLLEGTDIPYNLNPGSNVHWNKSLTVIGVGFNPDKQNPRKSKISYHWATWGAFSFATGAGGSKIYGIHFTNHIRDVSSVSDLYFENCLFEQNFNIGHNASNLQFVNCIFDGNNNVNLGITGTVNVVTGLVLNNCVFDGYIDGNNNPYVTMIVDHCLFLSTTTANFNSVQNATISNNIFMNTFPDGTTNSSYLNNLTRVAGTFPPVGGGGNTGSNNIENTNPNFANYTLGELYSSDFDFHLQPGSAAIGTGTDGTDIGVHGGGSGFSRYGEVLINPIIRSLTIQNPVVLPNGTLQVDIHASKPHDD